MFISGRERRRNGIDWEDTEDEEEEEKEEKEDDNYEIASAIKEVFGQFGLVFHPSEKLLFYRDTLVYFGGKENIRRIDRILSESCPGPIPVRRRSTALRLSPRLWLKWVAERDENLGDSVRSLGKQEVMTLLREVEQDKQSAILSSTTVTSRSGYTSLIQSIGSLFMPPESWQVGTMLEADSLVAHNSFCATMELVAKHVDLVPPKRRSDLPAFPLRSNEIETNAVMQFGRFYLLGSGGGIGGEPLVVWLVGLDWLHGF